MMFDTAVMSLVIHFTDADKTLKEMKRILKPGGTLIVANLDREMKKPQKFKISYKFIIAFLAGLHATRKYHMPVPKVNILTETQLQEKLEKAGFKVVMAETVNGTLTTPNLYVNYVKAVKVT